MAHAQAAQYFEYVAFKIPPRLTRVVSAEFVNYKPSWYSIGCRLYAPREMIAQGLIAQKAEICIGAIGHHDPIHCSAGAGFEDFLLQRKYPGCVDINGEQNSVITVQRATRILLAFIKLDYCAEISCFSEYTDPLYCRIYPNAPYSHPHSRIQFEYYGKLVSQRKLLSPLLNLCQRFRLKEAHPYLGTAYKGVSLSTLTV